jgi:hypothetical protein
VSNRVTELKNALEAKTNEIKSFMDNGIQIDGSNVKVSQDSADKVRQILKDSAEIKMLLEAEMLGFSNTNFLKGLEGNGGSAAMQAAAEIKHAFAGGSTLGEVFVQSDIFADFQKSGRGTMYQPFSLETADIVSSSQQKDIYTGMNTHTIQAGLGTRVQFDPMVPRGQRANRVRDLFPIAATANNLIDFFRVLGFVENSGRGNAAPVADRDGSNFATKPKSNLNFQPAQAPVRTIAHWEAAHRNIIQDVPQLQTTINNELLYGLALVEDDQILNGDGTGENLLGILNTPGIQIYTPGGAEPKADSLRKATTLAVIANYPPNGYVLHPNDWEDIELDKGTTNDHYRLITNIAVGLDARVWRQRVVESPAMTEGTFLNGSFGGAAQLYDRQQANVRIAEQHGNFFVQNAVAILVEERLALAVKRPEAFVKGTYQTA